MRRPREVLSSDPIPGREHRLRVVTAVGANVAPGLQLTNPATRGPNAQCQHGIRLLRFPATHLPNDAYVADEVRQATSRAPVAFWHIFTKPTQNPAPTI
jgi:hypothetical protein